MVGIIIFIAALLGMCAVCWVIDGKRREEAQGRALDEMPVRGAAAVAQIPAGAPAGICIPAGWVERGGKIYRPTQIERLIPLRIYRSDLF